MEPRLLTATGVGVRFEGVVALDEVDIEIRAGEILGLIGPNGAGKTTLVNVLSGFQRPTSGRVALDGRDVTGWSPQRLARHGVGRTFQSVRPFPALSVRENVELGALGCGRSPREAVEAADLLLHRLRLADLADGPAADLPHGDERRLGIARALAGAPAFLLLDEPAAGLNESEGRELVADLRALRADLSCGLVLIEHDMAVLMALSERVHVLDQGRTLFVGTPAEVRSHPEVLRAYLGTEEVAPHA